MAIDAPSRRLHIGIVAGSVEGAALCYRTIVLESEAFLGPYEHPRISLDNLPLSDYVRALDSGDFAAVATLLQRSIGALTLVGADFAIFPDNTFHVALPFMPPGGIPFVSIVDVVAAEAAARGFRRVGVLGTRITMQSSLYPDALENHGIAALSPLADEREVIDTIIQRELVKGRFDAAARTAFGQVIDSLRARGCDAVALACTEIPLLVGPEDSSLPTLDSTRLLARAALHRALGKAHV
jgi:aspartate racemase